MGHLHQEGANRTEHSDNDSIHNNSPAISVESCLHEFKKCFAAADGDAVSTGGKYKSGFLHGYRKFHRLLVLLSFPPSLN